MASIDLLLYISSYTHNDNAYAMYAFNFCIRHQVDTEVPSPARTCPSRAGGKCKADEVHPEWPVGGGGNFVDTKVRRIHFRRDHVMKSITLRDKASYCILLLYLKYNRKSACTESCILTF
jgi:hypothetical protein